MVKKIFNWITLALVLGLIVMAIVWLSTNWTALTSGTNLYTQTELEEYGEQEYDKGVSQAELYKAQSEELQRELSVLIADLAETQKQADKVPGLESEVSALEEQISSMQNQLARLQELVDEYDRLTDTTVIVTFYYKEEKVYNTLVELNTNVLSSHLPDNDYMKENYSVYVTEWKTSEGYTYATLGVVTEDIDFYATEYTQYFNVTFEGVGTYTARENQKMTGVIYDDNNTESDLTDDINITDKLFLAVHPEKEGYMFTGWSLDGVELETVEDIVVTSDLTFEPVYVEATKFEVAKSGLMHIVEMPEEIPFFAEIEVEGDTTETISATSWVTTYEPTNYDNVVFTIAVVNSSHIKDSHMGTSTIAFFKVRLGQTLNMQEHGFITFSLNDYGDNKTLGFTLKTIWQDDSYSLFVTDFYEIKE